MKNVEAFFLARLIPVSDKLVPLDGIGDIAGSNGNRSSIVGSAVIPVGFYIEHCKPPIDTCSSQHFRNMRVGAVRGRLSYDRPRRNSWGVMPTKSQKEPATETHRDFRKFSNSVRRLMP